MLPENLKTRLQKVYVDFDVVKAESLSHEIHDFETSGGNLTITEDEMWAKLTDFIFEWRMNQIHISTPKKGK